MPVIYAVQQVLLQTLELEGLSNSLSVGSGEGRLIRGGKKEERERKCFNGKHAIKNNPLSYILYSSANWKWETCEPEVHTSTSMASPSCPQRGRVPWHALCTGSKRAQQLKGKCKVQFLKCHAR